MRKLSIVGAKSFCDYYCSVDMWKGVWRLRLLAARCSGMLLRPLRLLLLKYFYNITLHSQRPTISHHHACFQIFGIVVFIVEHLLGLNPSLGSMTLLEIWDSVIILVDPSSTMPSG